MSFANDIKTELCEATRPRKDSLMLCAGACFAMGENGFRTECREAAVLIADCLKRQKIPYTESSYIKNKADRYYIKAERNIYTDSIPDISGDEDFGVFLRGVYLVCGIAANPEKVYQLEFFIRDEGKARLLLQLIEEHGMSARISVRRQSSFIYIKESEKMSDMLAFMGAMSGAMEIMNVKIFKEVRNNVNRSVNCETANIDKTIEAANRQIEDIEYIFKTKGEDYLPGELLQVAKIRLSANDLSLSSIGKLLDPPISRSGVNHRLRRISEIAQELRGER